MRWIQWGWLILLLPGGLLVYFVGWLILHSEGYRWHGAPTVYDGKESYAEWEKKMERARRLQEILEDER